MGDMTFGAVTLDWHPSKIDRVFGDVADWSHSKTIDGVATFFWGAGMVGEEFVMDWDFMPSTLFDSLKSLEEAGAPVVFDPQDGSARTFKVIIAIEGKYHNGMAAGAGVYRRNVRLEFLVTEEL